MKIAITSIENGYHIQVKDTQWEWWAYPQDHELRNNGERCKVKVPVKGFRLDLPPEWTLGNVIDDICAKIKRQANEVI